MTERKNTEDKPVYMISVAARLTGMHPQTLRIYERKQLLRPGRTPKSTRLYSERDINRLKLIQQLTHEEGVNLAGVKLIIELRDRLEALNRSLTAMEEQIVNTKARLTEEAAQSTRKERREMALIPKGVLVRWR